MILEIITIILMSLLLLLGLYLLIKMKKKPKVDHTEIAQMQNTLLVELAKEQGALKEHLAYQIGQNNEKIQKLYADFSKEMRNDVTTSLNGLNEKVSSKLSDGFDKTNETFKSILERMAKIDEAQKKIEGLSTNIISLQDILTDKKSRGTFGEISLYTILANVFGEKNDLVYAKQYHLKNGYIADAIVFCPEPLGNICIDSKFPLEDYQNMVKKDISEEERKWYIKRFKDDIKKHIDDISLKYINEETSNQALLFLPAEAIFAEINAYHPDLVSYAQKKRVWLTSPTTLVATLSTVEVVLSNLERSKHIQKIQDELAKLNLEFGRFADRWNKINRTIETFRKDIEEFNITVDKINKRFDTILKVEIPEEGE